jgi:flagellar protein FliO/FliZ
MGGIELMLLAQAAAKAPEALPTGYGSALLRMLAALVVVCVLAYVVLRFGLRRLAGPSPRASRMRVLERCPLGSGKALWIVRVGQRTFLVGAAEQGLNMLAELSASDLASADQEQSETSRPRFADVFARALGRKPASPRSAQDLPGPVTEPAREHANEAADRAQGGEGDDAAQS